MGALDRTIELQKQGFADNQIARQMQNEGFSPREIQDSINQAQVKNAVSDQFQGPSGMMQASMMGDAVNINASPISPSQSGESMPLNPPMPIQQQFSNQNFQNQNAPAQGDYPAQGPEVYPTQQAQDDYYPQTPQAYGSQDYYAQQGPTDTSTISEIAEQVFSDKFGEFTKKTGDIASFKNTIQDKVSDIDSRLKRIEETIDKLQQAVIGRIGEFGENTSMIHKDLENLHGTMAKMMNPLMDNYAELRKIARS
jgi:hypothetical protein